MMLVSRMHTTIEDVDFVDNVGGWEGNIYAKEGGTTLRLHRVSVSGQTGTLVTNDHGGTPNDLLDADGRPTLTEAHFNNRLYVAASTFSSNTGCVIFTYRWVSISDSTFADSGQVCLSGVSTDRVARTSFVGTVLSVSHPWSTYWGTRYVQLDDVSIRPSLTLNSQAIHVLPNETTVCGEPIESYTWDNPSTARTVIGDCAGVAPTWTDQELPELRLGVAVSDGVSADGDPEPSYAVTSGALPDGLALDAANGSGHRYAGPVRRLRLRPVRQQRRGDGDRLLHRVDPGSGLPGTARRARDRHRAWRRVGRRRRWRRRRRGPGPIGRRRPGHPGRHRARWPPPPVSS